MLNRYDLRATAGVTAKGHQHQLDIVDRADASSDAVEKAVASLWGKLLDLLQQGGPHIHRQAAELLRKLAPDLLGAMGDDLRDVAALAHEQAVSALVDHLPMTEAKDTKAEKIKSLVFRPPNAQETDEIVYDSAWQSRFSQLTKLAAPEALAAQIAIGVQKGETPAQLAKRIRGTVQGVQTSARRIARTESMRVAHDVHEKAWAQLGDAVVGYQIHATLDTRTRPEHRKRDGTKYWRYPKSGQLGLDKMPRPPREMDGKIAFNCRCYLTPIVDFSATEPTQTKQMPASVQQQTVKVQIDYQHRDESHPVAQEIANDHETRSIIEDFLTRVKESATANASHADVEKAIQATKQQRFETQKKLTDYYMQGKKSKKTIQAMRDELTFLEKKIDELEKQEELVRNQKKALNDNGRQHLLAARNNTDPCQWNGVHFTEPYDMTIAPVPVFGPAQQSIAKEAFAFVNQMTSGGHVDNIPVGQPRSTENRAFYDPVSESIAMPSGWATHHDSLAGGDARYTTEFLAPYHTSTLVHEMGHHIESMKPGATAKAKAFLEYRTQGEKPVQLNQLDCNKNKDYRDDEMGMKDQFDRIVSESQAYYIGKSYSNATELISMGLELMYKDPVGFAQKDPEYFHFVLSILRM